MIDLQLSNQRNTRNVSRLLIIPKHFAIIDEIIFVDLFVQYMYVQSFTKRGALGSEKCLPGCAWLLLNKTGPHFSASLYYDMQRRCGLVVVHGFVQRKLTMSQIPQYWGLGLCVPASLSPLASSHNLYPQYHGIFVINGLITSVDITSRLRCKHVTCLGKRLHEFRARVWSGRRREIHAIFT